VTDRICSIPDCGRRHKGRGFCEAHLDRWKRHGDPLHGGPVVTKGIHAECTFPGCGRPYKGRGYCEPHLERWKKHGDPAEGGPIRARGLLAECMVDGCHGSIKGHGYCSKHWQKYRKYGSPTAARTSRFRTNGEWKAYFYEPQPDTTECIVPDGYRGRPTVNLGFGHMYASRAMWFVKVGDPGKLSVLHTCDNDMCVNIKHLYLGDQLRNIRDSLVRERRGSRFLFSNADVVRIRSLRSAGISPRRIANQYDVHISRIRDILNGRTYRHVA